MFRYLQVVNSVCSPEVREQVVRSTELLQLRPGLGILVLGARGELGAVKWHRQKSASGKDEMTVRVREGERESGRQEGRLRCADVDEQRLHESMTGQGTGSCVRS